MPSDTSDTADSNAAQEPLIETTDLTKTYFRGATPVSALCGVTLQVPAGAFVVLLGPSGSGKSTLLHLLGGLDRPSSGQIRVAGVSLAEAGERRLTRFRREHIGFVFQFYNLLPALSALDNVSLPLLAQGLSLSAARQRGRELLEQVGLMPRQAHKPGQLSGGEQQRVAIARAIAARPAVVLADEPTGDLDSNTAQEVISLLADLNRELGLTILLATHNQALQAYASQCYAMHDGRLQACSPAP